METVRIRSGSRRGSGAEQERCESGYCPKVETVRMRSVSGAGEERELSRRGAINTQNAKLSLYLGKIIFKYLPFRSILLNFPKRVFIFTLLFYFRISLALILINNEHFSVSNPFERVIFSFTIRIINIL